MSETMERLQDVFREVFANDDLEISPATTAADIEEWDSLMHVNLMLAVENEFAIRFSSSEVAALKNVGELAGMVQRKAG